MTSTDLFPGWAGDPLTLPSPFIGLTPARSLAADLVMSIGAALVLLAPGVRRPAAWESGLVALGTLAVWLHAWALPGPTLQHLLTGSSWTAAFLAGLAARAIASLPRARVVLAAFLISLIVPLALRGMAQVFIEHPEVMRAYHADKAAILSSHGWTEQSPMARAYERRISQPEATGWFGLANVYATCAAASLAALLSLTILAARKGQHLPRLWRLMPGVAAVFAAAALAYARSKGGAGAFIVGFIMIVLAQTQVTLFGVPRARWARWLGPAAVAAVIALVFARGLIGPAVGELSLLVRSFYLRGALRIIAEHPWLGTGPAGFKDAYALAKPALATEDVSSPHSVLFDFLATLGVGGLAWVVVWLSWVRQSGSEIHSEPISPIPPGTLETPDTPESPQPDAKILALCIALATLIGTFLERALATPDYAIVRIGGALLACLAGAGLVRVLRLPGAMAALAAAAIAAAAHAQIELTAITSGASAWLCTLIALAVPSLPGPRAPRWNTLAAALAAALTTLGLAGGLWRTNAWESCLARAYDAVAPVAELDARLRAVSAGPTAEDSPRSVLHDIATALREPGLEHPGVSGQEVAAAMLRLRLASVRAALPQLERAAALEPQDFATAQALSRLWLTMASDLRLTKAPAAERRAAVEAASRIATEFRGVRTSPVEGWIGATLQARSELEGSPEALLDAVAHWQAAATLAPYAIQFPYQLALAHTKLGHADAAATWAARALANDANAKLDPTQQLTEPQRSEMKALSPRP